MARFELTDFEWPVIRPLLPTKARGVKLVDHRRVLNASSGGRARGRRGRTSRRAGGVRAQILETVSATYGGFI
jgi:transposase